MAVLDNPFAFFGCVAGVLAKRVDRLIAAGASALAAPWVGGVAAVGVAAEITDDVRKCLEEKAKRRKEANGKAVGNVILAELQQLPNMTPAEAAAAARRALDACPNLPEPYREVVLHYLRRIPDQARRSFRRPEDPEGRTVRPGADVRDVLPDRLSGLRENTPVPGHAGWTLERPLGSGGFGEVWLATNGKRRAVFKFGFELTDEERENLKHEADLVELAETALGPHPNLVPLRDKNLGSGVPWLRYDFVDGGDLISKIHTLTLQPPDDRARELTSILLELATAVGLLHRLPSKIVHRDLKPANILFDTATKRYRITDFGIGSIAAKRELTDEDGKEGTRGGAMPTRLAGSHSAFYASPEQVAGAAPDPRDDVYALGVIGFEMMCGVRQCRIDPKAMTGYKDALLRDGCPAPLTATICAAIGPLDGRPKDAEELAALLRPKSWPIPVRVLWVSAAVAVCLFCLLLGLLIGRGSKGLPIAEQPTAPADPPSNTPTPKTPAESVPPVPFRNEFELELVRTLDAGDQGVGPLVAFSPDGTLATSHRFRGIRLWKLDNPDPIAGVTADGPLQQLVFGWLPDRTPQLYTLRSSFHVERRDAETAILLGKQRLEGACNRIAASPTGKLFLSCEKVLIPTADPDITTQQWVGETWDGELKARLARFTLPEGLKGQLWLNALDGSGYFMPESKKAEVVYLNADGQETGRGLLSDERMWLDNSYSPDGGGSVLENFFKWYLLRTKYDQLSPNRAAAEVGTINAMTFTPGRKLLVIVGGARGSTNGYSMEFRAPHDGKLLALFRGSEDQTAASVAVSPDGKHLAVGSWNDKKREVNVWRIKPVPPVVQKK